MQGISHRCEKLQLWASIWSLSYVPDIVNIFFKNDLNISIDHTSIIHRSFAKCAGSHNRMKDQSAVKVVPVHCTAFVYHFTQNLSTMYFTAHWHRFTGANHYLKRTFLAKWQSMAVSGWFAVTVFDSHSMASHPSRLGKISVWLGYHHGLFPSFTKSFCHLWNQF